jgi:hypothetical protein
LKIYKTPCRHDTDFAGFDLDLLIFAMCHNGALRKIQLGYGFAELRDLALAGPLSIRTPGLARETSLVRGTRSRLLGRFLS